MKRGKEPRSAPAVSRGRAQPCLPCLSVWLRFPSFCCPWLSSLLGRGGGKRGGLTERAGVPRYPGTLAAAGD